MKIKEILKKVKKGVENIVDKANELAIEKEKTYRTKLEITVNAVKTVFSSKKGRTVVGTMLLGTGISIAMTGITLIRI